MTSWEVAQPPSILDSTAAQNASFATAPPLHLTNAGCPSEWLSPPAQPCSLLRFSLLPLGLEEPQPPQEKLQGLLLSLPVSLGTEKQVPVELSCQAAGLLWSRFALRVQKRKGDEIPEQRRTCASHQVHNEQPVKYSKHVSQASGIWAKSLQGNICVSPALPPLWQRWDLVSVARIHLEHQWPWWAPARIQEQQAPQQGGPGIKARGCCSRTAPSGSGLTHWLEKLHAVIVNRNPVPWKPWVTPGVTKVHLVTLFI